MVSVYSRHLYGGIPPPQVLNSPQKLVHCVKLFRLDFLLQVYRCSSKWKTTSLYYINCNMYFCEDSNVAHGIKVTVQHQGVATAVCVQNSPVNRKNSPHNAPKVAIWRPKIEKKLSGEGALPPPPVGRRTPLPTPHPIGACGASTRFPPKPSNFPPKLAVSRIDADCWCQKTRVIALSCCIIISAVYCLVSPQSMRMTDGQNCDSQDRAGIAVSRGKN